MARPLIRSHNITLDDLDIYAEGILSNMRKNKDIFPNPQPDLESFETILLEFRDALVDASHRDKRAVIYCRQLTKRLKGMIRDLSYYVGYIAQGDESIILAAGFSPSKSATPVGVAPQPKTVEAKSMGIGSCSIKIKTDRWPQAKAYHFEYRLKDADEDWTSILTTRSTLVLESLQQFKEYEVRVAYIATDPTITYSHVRSFLVV